MPSTFLNTFSNQALVPVLESLGIRVTAPEK